MFFQKKYKKFWLGKNQFGFFGKAKGILVGQEFDGLGLGSLG